MADNYILAYWQQISDGSVVVGKWIRLLYEKIVNGIEDGTYVFSQRKANNAIEFVETYCRHNKGKLAPQTIKLQLWQKAALSLIFGVLDHNGRRQFTEVFMILGRKMGKTLFASAVMAYIAFCAGEYGSEIYCVAPKLDQSDLVYSAFDFTRTHTPEFESISRKRKNDLIIDETNTTIKKIAFNEKKADGYNPMLTVCDEMSSWPADRGLKQYEVMVSGTGARDEPITLSISSGGYVNDGVYDELYKRGTIFLLGNGKEEHFLPIFYMIDDIKLWNDINELRKALPGLGVSVKVDFILDQIKIAETSFSKKAEFITKYCCLKQNSSQAWLAAELVEKARGKHMELSDFKECYGVAGLDLSQTTDLTAAVFVFERDKKLNIVARFFMPAELIDTATERDGIPYQKYVDRGELVLSGDNFVDYHDCENYFAEAIDLEAYPLYIGYDRYSAQYLVQDMKGNGFHMDDVYQGENLWGVIQEFEGMMKDGLINIGDNELLAIHLLDCAIKMSLERGRGKLVKIDQRSHIDGAAAVIDAMCVRQKWWHEIGVQLQANDPEGGE